MNRAVRTRLAGAWLAVAATLPLSCRPNAPEAPTPVPAPVAARPAAAGPGPAPAGPTPPPAEPQRPLSTAEIVARCEPSVALIVGHEGSGTGFLVRPGVLVTNAHVIEGEDAADLEVRFPSAPEGKRGPLKADLIWRDRGRDLAFLGVESELRPLEVARSYRFRKGDDVTVIGSPGVGRGRVLENAVSRGVMSTQAELDGQPFYQLSIAVNPGNSGGPVIDAAGRVIGVVTLKIARGEELAFGIPVEDLAHAIEVATGDNSQPVAEGGPAPALAYGWEAGRTYVYGVGVTIDGPDSVRTLEGVSIYQVTTAGADEVALQHKGWLISRRKDRRGDAASVEAPGQPTEVSLTLDRKGRVVDGEGKLPVALLGDLSTLVLEPLPERPRSSWEVDREVALQHAEVTPGRGGVGSLSPFDRFGFHARPGGRFGSPFGRRPPFGRPPRIPRPIAPPQPAQLSVTTIPAHEATRYRLGKDDAGAMQLHKEYELTTDAQAGGEPVLSMTGEGVTTFDPAAGLPRTVEFHGKLVGNDENLTVRVPFRMTCRLLDGAERSAALVFPVMPPTPDRPIAPADLDRALADLRSADDGRRRDAAHRLAESRPTDDRRSEVARALEPRLDDRDGFARREAANALGVWGDSDSRGPLIAHLKDEHYDARREVVDALARLGPDRAAAEAVAAWLGTPFLEVGRALRAMGPEVAEPALRSTVEVDGPIPRRAEACRVLGQLGTADSLSTLRALADRVADAELARVAGDAVRSIRERFPGAAELDRLIADLRSADGRARHDAAVRLARVAPTADRRDAVVRELIPLLTDRDGDTQTWAVRALDAWGAEAARSALIERVDDPRFGPWREAATVLGKLAPADEAAARAVAARLDQDRGRVFEALRAMGPVAEPFALEVARNHPDAGARREACEALAVVGTDHSVPTLEALADDRSVPFLDGAARAALESIRTRAGDAGAAGELLPKLRSKEIFARGDAIRRLLAAPPGGELKPEIARMLEAHLDPREAFGQDELYRALAVVGDDRTKATLLPLVSDPDNRHWRPAAEALAALGADAAGLRAIVARLKDDPGLVGNVLRKLGPAAEPALRAAVRDQDTDPRARVEACRLLATLGTPDSLPTLEPLAAAAELEPLARAAEEAVRTIEARD